MDTNDMQEEVRQDGGGRRRIGLSVFGWAIFAVVFSVFALVGYRTWHYYQLLQNGQIVELPQYGARLTSTGGAAFAPGPDSVRPELVESGDHPALGAEQGDAKITIVEFADFECPYSKDSATVVRRIAAKYGDDVRVIYRDYPIEEIHPNAFQAAMAAECAREQGKFWAYHDKLYVNSTSLDAGSLLRYAAEAGLDMVQFETCVTSARYRDKVAEDNALARELGLRGTPTFFIDGQRVEGSIPEADFERIIDRMLLQ